MLHQYRLIRACTITDEMKVAVPRLCSFMTTTSYISEYDQMFGHELAHALELVDRGQEHRLKLDNFGWKKNLLGHTYASATIECKVFALQYLFETVIYGRPRRDILDIDGASCFISAPLRLSWKNMDDRARWLTEGAAKERILNFMEEYKPKFNQLLNTTVNYIVDECAEFI